MNLYLVLLWTTLLLHVFAEALGFYYRRRASAPTAASFTWLPYMTALVVLQTHMYWE